MPKTEIDMKAEEFLKGCEHDGSFIPVGEVIRLMEAYANIQRGECQYESDDTTAMNCKWCGKAKWEHDKRITPPTTKGDEDERLDKIADVIKSAWTPDKENICIGCGNSVGNNVFTLCDDCWDKYKAENEPLTGEMSEKRIEELAAGYVDRIYGKETSLNADAKRLMRKAVLWGFRTALKEINLKRH